MFSGDTAPTGNTYMLWYDTKNNSVKTTTNSGSSWVEGHSLPVCLSTSDSTQITSIDQIFNGMGYIGSTIWVDKGVKGLIPDGRNADGTLNNIEVVTQKVLTITFASNLTTQPNTARVLINQTGTGLFARIGSFDAENNYILGANGVDKLFGCIFAENGTVTNGVVDSFDFKKPFRAVDYNDISNLTMGMPDYSAGVSKSNNVQYTAETNGFLIVELGFGWQFTLIVNGTSLIFSPNGGQQGWKNTISFLIKKGSTYKMDVVANGFVKAVFYPMT
jgi:hypothetical protein